MIFHGALHLFSVFGPWLISMFTDMKEIIEVGSASC
jgi:hypothetical protein